MQETTRGVRPISVGGAFSFSNRSQKQAARPDRTRRLVYSYVPFNCYLLVTQQD